MIGQEKLKTRISELIENNNFPRFILLVGSKGSGKSLIAQYISKKLKATCVHIDIKVDAVREMIKMSYQQSEPIVYVLNEANRMSTSAKNALLKVTEEPPQNAYFILEIQDINQILNTLVSRAYCLHMDNYKFDELLEYAKTIDFPLNKANENVIHNVCITPGDIDTLSHYNVSEFWDYVIKVVENISIVNGYNSFKIGEKINLKNSQELYDLSLFWRAFMGVCMLRFEENPLKYAHGISITSKFLQELTVNGINVQSTFDMWILEIRERWMEDEFSDV